MKLLIIFVSIFTVILVALNVHATRLVLRSEIHSRFQKVAQIMFVWIIPLIGAAITREIHTAKYIKPKEPWAEHGYHGDERG